MDAFQLKLFTYAVRYGSLSKAAEQTSITQSAASQSIARLEAELNTKLFIREKRRIQPSRDGLLFYSHAINILKEIETAQQELSENKSKISGMLYLQVLAASALLPQLLYNFMVSYPDVQFRMVQLVQPEDYDLSISATIENHLPPSSELLFEEEVFLAVPPDHHLAPYQTIHLSETQHEHFVMMRAGSNLRQLANTFCKRTGFEPQILFEADNPFMLREMISMGLGVAFLPRVSWTSFIDEKIKLLRIADMQCVRRIYIHVPAGRTSSRTVIAFKQYAIDYFKKFAENVQGSSIITTSI